MRKLFALLVVLITNLQSFAQSWQPIIPNKIADKYIPAHYQDIGGLLGYRLNVNLEKRLLQIDSATLLSGFRKRPPWLAY